MAGGDRQGERGRRRRGKNKREKELGRGRMEGGALGGPPQVEQR